MSLSLLIPTALGGAQAAVSSASIVKNILAGLTPSASGLDAISRRNKDIRGFQFDYAGERRLEAGVEITDHFNENNDFMQDHAAIKPTRLALKGFISETSYNKKDIFPALLALSTALTPITPYLGKYAPGAAAKMNSAVNQTDAIINQIIQAQAIYGNIGALNLSKLVGALPQKTKVQRAYDTLNGLRIGGATFTVVTPWATFGASPDNGHGPMMIENLIIVEPDDTKGWNDIMVILKEIRIAPSLLFKTLNNPRASQINTFNGNASAK